MTKSLNSLDIMRVAFQTYAQRAGTVLTVSLAINLTCLVASIVAMNVFGAAGIFVYLVLVMFASQLTTGASTLLVSGLWTTGEAPESSDLIKQVLARGGALFCVALLYSIGVGFFSIFLLIPGIYVAIKWSLAAPALLIRKVGVNDAFKTSGELTSQAMGPTFAVVFFTFLFNILLPYYLTSSSGGETAPLETQVITQFVLSALISPVMGLAYAELYMRLAHVIPPPVQHVPAPTGPWIGVPQPVHGMAAPANPGIGGYSGGFGAPAATAATAYDAGPSQPYGAPAAAAYGGPAPQAYAAPAGPPFGAPQPYGAPAPAAAQPYGTPAPAAAQPYGTPAPAAAQPYGTPAPAVPQPYAAPAAAPQHYGTPAQPPYGAPTAAPPYGAPAAHGGATPSPYGAPPAPQAYGTPAAAQPQPLGGPPAPAYPASATPAQPYGAPAAPSAPPAYGAPAPGAPGAPLPGAPGAPAPSWSEAAATAPARPASVPPPGM